MKTLSAAILGLLIATSPVGACSDEGAKLIAKTICEVGGGVWRDLGGLGCVKM